MFRRHRKSWTAARHPSHQLKIVFAFLAGAGIITASTVQPDKAMEPTAKTASKLRIVLTWFVMVGVIIVAFLVGFFLTRGHAPPAADESETPNIVVHSVVSLLAGGFFLVLGVAGYFAVIYTGCFTFDYNRPVWQGVKTRQFFANIIVTVGLGLGLGFIVAAFLSPTLTALGLDAGLANMLPVMAVIMGCQMMQLWVLIWSPVEKRTIVHRLAAQGISPAQLQGATLVGLSDPASGLAKRFAAIEEDMGALWVTPEMLMYRGDAEQFDLSRDQIAEIERRTDNRSTSVLAGIAHVILHVRLPDGSIRQIRLHTEGLWTMGRKKRMMGALAAAVEGWHAGA